MRLAVFLMLISCTAAFASDTYSQTTKLSLKGERTSLEELLVKIEEQSEFRFFYTGEIDVEKEVTGEYKNKKITDILDNIKDDAGIEYEVMGRQIVLWPANAESTIKSVQQQKSITGTVTDESGEPLPGASISIKGKTTGTISDSNGEYQLEVSGNDVIVISFIGYVSQEITIDNQQIVDVVLVADIGHIDELVVTALGISRQKKALPYNTQTIEADELVAVRDANNVMNSLQGKVANALITQSSSGVGGESRIVLRGNSSINGSNSALIVVDGIPNSQGVNINPDDIESMTVLGGAAAAALYGSEAGNGVIVITTKKGKKETASISVNSGLTFNSPFSLPDFQNEYGQGINGVIDPMQGNSWGEKMTGSQYTNYLGETKNYSAEPDNVRDFFNTGVNANNSISISSGGEKAQGYLSYTNAKLTGIVPNNTMQSHNINLRLSNQLTKRLSTDAKLTYYTANVDGILYSGEGNNAVCDIYQTPRNIGLDVLEQFETTDEFGVVTPETYVSPIWWRYQNPYWVTKYDRRTEDRSQIFGFISAKYELTDWLSVKGRANIDKVSILNERKVNQGTVGMTVNPGGIYDVTGSDLTNQWYDFSIDGSNDLGESLIIDYHVGGIYQDKAYDQSRVYCNGLNITNKFSTNFATNPVPSQSAWRINTQSLYALVNLAYKNAFYLDASVRNDWDSRLPAPHAYQYYSVGGSALISEIFELPSSISFMKLTASYAEVGNGGEFGLLETTYAYSAGTANGYISRSGTYSIPDLKPEIVQNKEVGLEARFFNNRLTTEISYYNSNAKNQLLTIGMPFATGYSSQYINAGNIQNQGVELIVSTSIVNTGDFIWGIDFNASYNKNEVIELSEGLDVVYQGGWLDWGGRPQVAVGGSYGDMVATTWARNDAGQLLVTNDGLPITSGAMGQMPSVIGNFNPDAIFGLTNTFSYKGVSLRVLLDGRVGGVVISGTEGNLSHSGITESTLPYREGGWNLGGVNTDGEAVNTEINAQQFWQTVSGKRWSTGEFYAYDATNFRLRELSLGYNIPLPQGFFIKSARFSVVGRNLLWLYRGKSILDIPGMEKRTMWLDPDVTMGSTNYFKGVEYNLPSTRSIGFNLSLNF